MSLTQHVNTGFPQTFEQCICEFVGIRLHVQLRCCQTAYNFSLTLARNFAIAKKGRQYFFVPKILTTGLELLRDLAGILAELDKRIPEAMRVKVQQTGLHKGLTKYCANRRCSAPVFFRQATGVETSMFLCFSLFDKFNPDLYGNFENFFNKITITQYSLVTF